ncbi:MAG: calmodulin [Amphiamblys sp. WSBS2006]|nr:MAG: calmodulin [Amphiamblys sp. WSBS2006]
MVYVAAREPEMVQGLTEEQRRELSETFEFFDTDKDGRLRREELESVVASFGQDVSEDALCSMFADVDMDTDGMIALDAFLSGMAKQLEEPFSREEVYQKTFSLFDKKKRGVLDKEDIRQMMISLGEEFTESSLERLFQETGADGPLSYEEFRVFMERKPRAE